MREIIFRGKRVDNGEWVEGFYVLDPQADEGKESQIYYTNEHPCGCALVPFAVIPETVGQYTGLTDKNGKKIFEGDILKFEGQIGVLFYNEKFSKFMFQVKNSFACYQLDYTCDFEVVGNIHDNPELLEGE